MPANPMGRGLPMASMVLPEDHAPEVSAEAGAAFLAVLATTQSKPVMPGVAVMQAETAAAIAPLGGDSLSDLAGEQLLASAPLATAAAPAIAPTGGDNLSDLAGDQLEASPQPAIAPAVAPTGGDNLSDLAGDRLVAPAAPATAPAVAPTEGDTLSDLAGDQLVAPATVAIATAIASPAADTPSAPAGAQFSPLPGTAPVASTAADTLSPPAGDQLGSHAGNAQPVPTPTPTPTTRPVRLRERTSQGSTKAVAAPVAVDVAPLAPPPSEPPPVQAPDVAAHVARATEAADASSASSVRAFGLRHVRLAVPTENGAIRARMTVDRATETVDVAIRGTDDVGLTASRRVSELREGLAQHGLKLGVFDASAVTTDVARASTSEPSPELFQQAFDGSDHHSADPRSERGPEGGPTGAETDSATSATSDEAPPHPEAPTRRTPNRWDDDATVGQLLDLRI